MRTILTPDVLKTMSCDEFEDWRDSGEDFRRELTHAVMRDLSCPEKPHSSKTRFESEP